MSRIRSIKPEFWTSEQIIECSTNARLLFIGLWNFCDDAGRHPFSPRQVKAEVFPADDFTEQDIVRMLDELSTNGLIVRYEHGGKGYFYVSGWKHQKIDRPQPAKYPEPLDEHSTNARRTFVPDRIGYDTIGEDSSASADAAPQPAKEPAKKERRKPATSLPPEFHLDRSYAKDFGFSDSEIGRELERFKNHAAQNGRKCVDWAAAWRNWVLKAAEFAGKTRALPPGNGAAEVALGTPEWAEWLGYVREHGPKYTLRVMEEIENIGVGRWTFPSKHPPAQQAAA